MRVGRFAARALGLITRARTACLALVLVACGGGSDSGFSARFTPSRVEVSTIQGHGTTAEVTAALAVSEDKLFLRLEATGDLLIDVDATADSSGAKLQLWFDGNLPVGKHTGELLLHACHDLECRPPAGTARLPLTLTVLPNLQIASPQAMRRQGADATPRQTLAINAPAAAGALALRLSGDTQAFDARLVDGSLVVDTHPLPAGTYRLLATVSGSADPRYQASATIEYTVEPPPAGQFPLRISSPSTALTLAQGTVARHRFHVSRPTWTNTLDPPVLDGAGVATEVVALGNDDFEVVIDTRNVPVSSLASGPTRVTVRFTAGPFGGEATFNLYVSIDAPVAVDPMAVGFEVTASSGAAVLTRRSMVLTPANDRIRFSASSTTPWLRLTASAGTTGVDELALQVDPAVLDLPGSLQEGHVDLQIDRVGALPVRIPVVVVNRLPRIDAATPGQSPGGQARYYLHGRLQADTGIGTAGMLSVDGARLVASRWIEDSRFVGSNGVLAVDLDGVVPGRAITIAALSALRPSSIAVMPTATPTTGTGYAALPTGSYRPPTYSAQQRAVVFAGSDAVWVWRLPQATSAEAVQRISLAGALDALWSPDERTVTAVTADRALALNPSTGLELRRAALSSTPSGGIDQLDAQVPAAASILRRGVEGRMLASMVEQPTGAMRKVATLLGCRPPDIPHVDISFGPCPIDPSFQGIGIALDAPQGPGIALASSASGQTVVATRSDGLVKLVGSLAQTPADLIKLPIGQTVVSLSDSGTWTVTDTGRLTLAVLLPDGMSADLRGRLPEGYTAAGYGLSADGNLVAVYGYRLATENGAARARDARLFILDLRGGRFLTSGATPLAAEVPLPEAVGCTGAAGSTEPCAHLAHVSVLPGNLAAVVLGPRGIAAVELPPLAPLTAAGSSTKTTASPSPGTGGPAKLGWPLRRFKPQASPPAAPLPATAPPPPPVARGSAAHRAAAR